MNFLITSLQPVNSLVMVCLVVKILKIPNANEFDCLKYFSRLNYREHQTKRIFVDVLKD